MKSENQTNNENDLDDPIDITPVATPDPEEPAVDPMFVTPERPVASSQASEPPRIARRGQSVATNNPVRQAVNGNSRRQLFVNEEPIVRISEFEILFARLKLPRCADEITGFEHYFSPRDDDDEDPNNSFRKIFPRLGF